MPSRNTIKEFDSDSVYHVYNRGVDKRIIFTDERDYAVFLSFLKYALLSDDEHSMIGEVDKGLLSEAERFNIRREGLANKVELLSFCLMPNHFHLLLYQYDVDGITKLMRSIATGYALYFNKRHGRVGALFQGRYKASRIRTDEYWLHISRYIHLNPLDIKRDYKTYPYSSYRNFVGEAKAEWLKPEKIMDGFQSIKKYEEFVEEYIPHRKQLKEIQEMLANSRELEKE
jgi:putative transposase